MFLGKLLVSWLGDINYLIAILLGVAITFIFKASVLKLRKTLFLFDTIGIGICTIIGLQKSLAIGIHPVMACVMGLFSAVLGGVIRDALCNEVPLIFKKEIYATACLLGAIVYVLLMDIQALEDYLNFITITIIIIVRAISLKFNLSLPQFNLRISS